MSEMVERVAQAMVLRRGLPVGALINWDAFREDARAAIEAMREPTERMVSAGMLAGAGPDFADPDETWRSMIDAILKVQP